MLNTNVVGEKDVCAQLAVCHQDGSMAKFRSRKCFVLQQMTHYRPLIWWYLIRHSIEQRITFRSFFASTNSGQSAKHSREFRKIFIHMWFARRKSAMTRRTTRSSTEESTKRNSDESRQDELSFAPILTLTRRATLSRTRRYGILTGRMTFASKLGYYAGLQSEGFEWVAHRLA